MASACGFVARALLLLNERQPVAVAGCVEGGNARVIKCGGRTQARVNLAELEGADPVFNAPARPNLKAKIAFHVLKVLGAKVGAVGLAIKASPNSKLGGFVAFASAAGGTNGRHRLVGFTATE